MRAVGYLPLAFIAGTHGFAMLAPYLLAICILDHLLHVRRRS